MQDRTLYYMEEALKEAQRALEEGELPVGAVVVSKGAIIARGHNEREQTKDPTAHAEIVAMRRAASALGQWRLNGCSLVVTLEPCPMCAGAINQARVERLVYGAKDPRQGCAGSVYRLTEDPSFTHFTPADGGILEEACEKLLKEFFRNRRSEGFSSGETEN